MGNIKITVLVENSVYRSGLRAEHGLSLLIDTGSCSILFDTGQSSMLLKNAESLGIDLSKADAAVISHGHYDHAGGLKDFCSTNSKAEVYLHREALLPKYREDGSEIGMPVHSKKCESRLTFVGQELMIDEGVYLLTAAPIRYKNDMHFGSFYRKKHEEKIADMFEDEISMVIVKDNKLIIISGCSHRGITNIIDYAVKRFDMPISYVVGGFHLKNSSEQSLAKIAEIINTYDIGRIGVCHCTGIESYAYLKQKLIAEVQYCSTGDAILL